MRRELRQVRDGDLETLIELGRRLDMRPEALKGASVRQFLAESLLKVRNKRGRTVRLRVNEAQKEFDRCAGAKNIVLKARQVEMTTWAAARFFLEVITKPGTLAVQVAHDQNSAEEIFQN
jgi:uncharacterized protein (DUF2141 family)